MEGDGYTKLQSGHKLYYKGHENTSLGGVGILIHRKLTDRVKMIKAISERVIYVTIQINKLETLKIIQAYAPTSTAEDEEVSKFYEDISEGMLENATSKVLVIGDFNCKIGGQADPEEKYVGKHGLGKRNPRGAMMANFLEEEHLYNANTFFQKSHNRKWTRASSDGRTFNQIDYILTKNIHIVHNVEVLNRFNKQKDHNHTKPSSESIRTNKN